MPEYKWRIFAVTGLASISSAIAISSINLALPIMSEEFGISMSAISWLPLIFSLVPCCTMLIFGRLADIYGYKRQFIGGFLVFGLASLLLPLLAKGLPSLIFFRGLQSLGYSMMISITQAMCNRAFPANERGKALGVNSIFVSVGLSAGPSVGGMLLSHFSWRSIFYFNAPFSFIGILMAVLILRKEGPDPGVERRMDWIGSLFFTIFIGFLAVAINFSAEWGFVSALFLGSLLASLAAFVVFVWIESRTKAPLMRLALYKVPVFSLSNGASVSSYILQQMTNFLMPFFLINILLLSRSDAGLVMLATPLTMMFFSPFGGRLADRYGSRSPAMVGLLIISLGSITMCFLSETIALPLIVAALLLHGVGIGLSVSAINSAIFSAVPREHSGMASGMVATLRNLGQSLGVAFGGAIMAIRQNTYHAAALAEGADTSGNRIYLMAQRDAFCFGLVVLAAAFLCMYRIPKKADEPGGEQ
ncbi:MAG: MFS transporter [Clostridiales bacterium]|nr:MFS transporter [Clostridiales bacterium]